MRTLLLSFLALSVGSIACSATDIPPSGETPQPGDAMVTESPSRSDASITDAAQASDAMSAIVPGWGAAACPVPSATVGFAVGSSIGDLGVQDCDTGAPTTIDELCGAKATWIFSAHTHCPTCQATAAFTDEVAAAVVDKEVAVIMTVYDDNGTSCAKWRDAYKLAGLANVRVYADPKGSVFAKLKTSNFTAPSAFLDKNRVVTYREHGLSKAQVLSQIGAALQ